MSATTRAVLSSVIGLIIGLTGLYLLALGVLRIVGAGVLAFTIAAPTLFTETNVPSFEWLVLPWILFVVGLAVAAAGLALFLHGLARLADRAG